MNTVSASPLMISILAYGVVIALIYLRRVAAKAGLKQEGEHWNVFGLLPIAVAGLGIKNGNVWVSLIALVTAIAGLVLHAWLFLKAVKPAEAAVPAAPLPPLLSRPEA